jgi:hypothetical protein
MVIVLPDMLSSCQLPQNSVLLSTRKQKLTQYLSSQLLLQYVWVLFPFTLMVFPTIDLLDFTPNVSTFCCHTYTLQSHMNKDHTDDTKLIVQYSTTVKASTCTLM